MDSRLINPRAALLLKPSLLKDHLLDDMSSCSSNGFKSFPRRQCCTAVIPLFFHEKQHKKQLNLNATPSKSALSAIRSVITAVKRFPFAAVKSPEKNKFKNSFLSRNFSKKILLGKSSFWKRSKSNRKQIERWILYDNLLMEDPEPSDHTNSSSESKSKSWSGSDFTVGSDDSNSSSEVNLNLPKPSNDVVEQPKKVVSSSDELGESNGDVSTDSTACSSDASVTTNSSTIIEVKLKQWSKGEKEQLSPVSVLDCPFEDEDENEDEDEVSSPFQHKLARVEGSKKKLMMKIQKLESLAQLEPLNLSKRFSSLQDSYNEPTEYRHEPRSPTSTDEKFVSDIEEEQEEEEDEAEQKALELQLLHRTMDTFPSYNELKPNSDKLLLDFFSEKITDGYLKSEKEWSFDKEVLEEAEDWINGRKTRELFLEWNVHKNRQVYIRDMEKRGEWKILDEEHKEVVLELESEVFGALLDEILLDISALW
ncbi:hypothetical protein BUALT_Bualt10G0038300 [Buddleja alternifolia]|uniref:DUF4378 domain-containing protein n=1 Tax=Buddleja alternifolia TaxID=168488 RepID=A0AAV6WWY1_9LAMI|nr:hypothetical protein BUALT_Bualt10G0038300 [Buddleja alternifolia]